MSRLTRRLGYEILVYMVQIPDAMAQMAARYPEGFYPAAMVNITNRCNLECEHCFVYRDGNPNEEAAAAEEITDDEIIAELTRLKTRHGIQSMVWMGGEPMLRRKFLPRAVSLFRQNTVTTNGTIPLMELENTLYVVSLDGPEDINDPIRGEGVYRRVMKTLRTLPDAFPTPVQVQCVVTAKNWTRLEELIVDLQTTKVGWMTFSFYVPQRRDTTGNAWDSLEDRDAAVEEVRRLKTKYDPFIRNTNKSLDLLLSPNAKAVTDHCWMRRVMLPLYLEGKRFVTPYCCYGDDVDCDACGSWSVFHFAAKMGVPDVDQRELTYPDDLRPAA